MLGTKPSASLTTNSRPSSDIVPHSQSNSTLTKGSCLVHPVRMKREARTVKRAEEIVFMVAKIVSFHVSESGRVGRSL